MKGKVKEENNKNEGDKVNLSGRWKGRRGRWLMRSQAVLKTSSGRCDGQVKAGGV